MKGIKNNFRLFKYNLGSIILFEIIYKLLSAAVLVPVLYAILNYSIKLAGIGYISARTLSKYLHAPSTYVLFICVLLVVSIYILINISALIYAMDASHRKEKIHPLVLLFKGFLNALRIINPKNIGMGVYVLFILPFTYTVMITGSVVSIKMPDFVALFLERHRVLMLIAILLYLILCIISLRRIFALNYYTLYRLNYRDSVVMSKKTIKGKAFTIFFGLIVFNICLTVILFLFEGTLTTIVAGILKKIISYKKLNFVLSILIEIFFVALYLMFSVISTPLIYSYLCGEFYDIESDIPGAEYEEAKRRRGRLLTIEQQKRRNRRITIGMAIAGLVLNGTYIYLSLNNRVNINIMYPTRAQVTAHRGDSKHAPENTMSAFELAVENQADIIELDVRQTKDGRYIIMHDEKLKRTIGVNHKVGEVDYEYIEGLDAGIKFSEEYKGEKIPTLEEVLIFAKDNDVFLNIELKPAKTDTNYTQGIVDLLAEYDMLDQCVVASADYDAIKEVKAINSDITTVYIMNMAVGSFADMEDVDIFSIKHTFITANMVRDIHKSGKEIYAWTVNSEADIKNLLLLDVDSIITDNPYRTKEIIFNSNDTMLSDWLKRLVEEY